MITRADNRKIMELSDRCMRLAEEYAQGVGPNAMSDGDMDGAFMAVIMEAIAYGKTHYQGT